MATKPATSQVAESAVKAILLHIGEDPEREGLLKTPARVVKAFEEMTEGYAQDPAAILSTVFDEHSDEMVICSNIHFVSLCEHHLLPFTGTAAVAYIPRKKVVGLSKLARLVHCYAKRLQVQERMTTQITDALIKHLDAEGTACLIRAHHQCMSCRGVKQSGAVMTTSSLTGAFREPEVRAEFLMLATQK